ncbi:uncharacterized protein LOC110624271 [Manihot esculenta]|uniref:DUF7870 domain-containing protein n=1 Tax=Manihot esculenta TaxID=3983 RepID=A0A2C9V6I4_MANES|nr:uncharacterized protein LOC110624271 [Manihot esculenta]OAY39520.1 hypothetical protein MANES_10G101400v8 [Manihot esculenta]
MKHSLDGGIGLNSDTLLVIKLPDSQILRIVSRSVFLAVFLLTLPCIGSILKELSSTSNYNLHTQGFDSDLIAVEYLESLLLDLANEGLIKKGDKAFFVSAGIGAVIDNLRFLNANEIELVLASDLGQQVLFHDASFDFVFGFGIEDFEFLDQIVKVGGVLVTQLTDLPNAFQKKSNYRLVYLRRYSSTIVAMKKTSLANELVDSSYSRRQLCELSLEAKKASLDGLEDVLLEPPMHRKFLKKFNYFPDLLGDSLEDYPRRVFVDVSLQEEKDRVMAWFHENYPTRNQNFEIYNIEMVLEGVSKTVAPSIDVSDWLMKNVKQDEFVVMKAEAEVVEEMIRRKTIDLVDELFLECENQWHNGEEKRSKRAYWECLALYGRLRDKGIAVHQWWS